MPITQVDIANEALDLVGASTILSLNDPTPEARIVARHLWVTIDRVLQSYPFVCALKTVSLDPDRAISLPNGQAFRLPEDCLRTHQIDADHWQQKQVDGRPCLTVADAGTVSLRITYVARLSDPNQLDPLVRELIALELAIKIAASLTESPQRISALTRKAVHVRKLAQLTDARQQSAFSIAPVAAELWSDVIGV